MKILCIIPPYLPSYFNAGHHLPIFQVGEYLRKNISGIKVKCYDGAALNTTWKEVCNLLIKHYDVIIIMNDFDAIDTFERFMRYKKNISPNTKVITFGRLSKQIPKLFFRFNLNAVAFSGDYESSVASYINYLLGKNEEPLGVLLSTDDNKREGLSLPPEKWELPNVSEIPYKSYNFMYRNDLNKFCGIPERQELVIPLARGCPYACHFCDIPFMQGLKERRLGVDRVIGYIESSFAKLPFEYFTFYAPTFTIKKNWVLEFCKKISDKPRKYPWKCITVLKLLNESLVKGMSEANCVRISIGIESFTKKASMKLPKAKQDILKNFKTMVAISKKYNIELNCFIVLGLPGDTPENVKFTIETCLKHGVRIRPAIYTPYDMLREDMSVSEVADFNRQYFPAGYMNHQDALAYYQLFYALKGDNPTQVMNQIPVNQPLKEG